MRLWLAFLLFAAAIPIGLANFAPVDNGDELGSQNTEADPAAASAPTSSPPQGDTSQPLVNPDAPASQAYVSGADQGPSAQTAAPAVTEDPFAHDDRLPLEEQVRHLRQQMSNWQSMKVGDQVSQMQQQLQSLQGRIEVLSHQLSVMQAQNQAVYQDFDHRLTGLAHLAPSTKKTEPEQPSSASKPVKAVSSQEQASYQKSYTFIKNKQYDKAIMALKHYVASYPEGQFAANAHYWLGELYLIKNANTAATEQFQLIVDNFPTDPKVPDAMVRLGTIAYLNGQRQLAEKQWQRVVNRYPNTAAAKSAKQQLQQLTKKV